MPDPGLFYPQAMVGVRDANIWPLYGQEKIGGAVDGYLAPINGIQLLVYAIGTDVVTGASNPFTHTISAANTLTSMTIEKNLSLFQSEQYTGCMVNKFTLKLPTTNEAVSYTADIIGQGVNVMDTPTAISTKLDQTAPFVFAEGAVSLFGQTLTLVTNVEISIENTLKDVFTVQNSHLLAFLVPTTRKVSGKLTLVFDSLDDVTWGYFKQAMPSLSTPVAGALVTTLTHPTNAGSVQITLPNISMAKITDAVKVGDVIYQDVEFTAAYSFGTSYSIQSVIQNSVSTAY